MIDRLEHQPGHWHFPNQTNHQPLRIPIEILCVVDEAHVDFALETAASCQHDILTYFNINVACLLD